MRRIQNILIIRFSSIGDIILSTPLIRCLRAAYPAADIDYIVKSDYAELVRCNPHLTTVIAFSGDGFGGLRRLRENVQSKQYDVLLDLHNSLRSRAVRMLSGIRYIRVINKRVIARSMLVKFKWNIYPRAVPVADRYLETTRGLNVRDDGKGTEIHVPEETEFAVAAILSRLHLDRFETVVGLAPAARHFTKRWPAEHFVAFAHKFGVARKVKYLVFGGETDSELCTDIAHTINTALGTSAADPLAGTLSLLETAAALDRCHLLVTNDTGMMHLAAARRRKVVAIFGSTVEQFGFFPYATEHVVLQAGGLYCRPCSHIGLSACPEGHFRCMKSLSPEEVCAAVDTLLQSSNPMSCPAKV